MGVLAALLAFVLAPAARADIDPEPSPLHGFDVTTDDSAGSGQYSLGLSTELRFGSEDDFLNQTASVRASYALQTSRETPGDGSSPLLHMTNWGGGVSVFPWTDGSAGVDLDSSSDDLDGLFTNGVKFGAGWKAFNLSYRFAKTEIQQGFPGGTIKKPVTFKGAFIYQNQFGGDITFPVGRANGFVLSGSYSYFNPDASGFATLISRQVFSSLGPLQNSLESFEVWDARAVWKHYFPHQWDSTIDVRYAHLVFPVNPHWDVSMAGGHDFTRRIHGEIGMGYSHDTEEHQLLGRMQVRYSWDRGD